LFYWREKTTLGQTNQTNPWEDPELPSSVQKPGLTQQPISESAGIFELGMAGRVMVHRSETFFVAQDFS